MDSILLVHKADTTLRIPSAMVTIGPNPSTGAVFIGGLQPNLSYNISLVNFSGKEVIRMAVQGQSQTTLQMDSLPPGLYFMQVIEMGSGKIISTVKLLHATP